MRDRRRDECKRGKTGNTSEKYRDRRKDIKTNRYQRTREGQRKAELETDRHLKGVKGQTDTETQRQGDRVMKSR